MTHTNLTQVKCLPGKSGHRISSGDYSRCEHCHLPFQFMQNEGYVLDPCYDALAGMNPEALPELIEAVKWVLLNVPYEVMKDVHAKNLLQSALARLEGK